MKGAAIGVVMLALLSAAPRALAHPDVWIDNLVTVVFDDAGRLAEVRERWAFDYAYSALASRLLDKNENGAFDLDELIAAVGPEGVLGWIGQTKFMTRLTVAGTTVPQAQVRELVVSVAEGKLIVEFTVPMSEPTTVVHGAGIDVFDETYYYGFQYAPVQAVGAPASCRVGQRWGPNLTADGAPSREIVEKFLADDMYAVRVQVHCQQ